MGGEGGGNGSGSGWGFSGGVAEREARRLRNDLARDAPATFPDCLFVELPDFCMVVGWDAVDGGCREADGAWEFPDAVGSRGDAARESTDGGGWNAGAGFPRMNAGDDPPDRGRQQTDAGWEFPDAAGERADGA